MFRYFDRAHAASADRPFSSGARRQLFAFLTGFPRNTQRRPVCAARRTGLLRADRQHELSTRRRLAATRAPVRLERCLRGTRGRFREIGSRSIGSPISCSISTMRSTPRFSCERTLFSQTAALERTYAQVGDQPGDCLIDQNAAPIVAAGRRVSAGIEQLAALFCGAPTISLRRDLLFALVGSNSSSGTIRAPG